MQVGATIEVIVAPFSSAPGAVRFHPGPLSAILTLAVAAGLSDLCAPVRIVAST